MDSVALSNDALGQPLPRRYTCALRWFAVVVSGVAEIWSGPTA